MPSPFRLALTLLAPLTLLAGSSPAQTVFYQSELDADQAGQSGSASGRAELVIDPVNDVVGFLITLDGLSSSETRATLNGPALPGSNGPVLYDLPLGNFKIGSWSYPSDNEELAFLAGLIYVEIQTTNHATGEIRGQITPRPVVTCVCSFFQGDAPCANYGSLLTGGCRNSAGQSASLQTTGLSSALLDTLSLQASGLPPGKAALLSMSRSEQRVPFGNGLLCVGQPLFRFPLQVADGLGQLQRGPGLVFYSFTHNPPSGWIFPGQIWFFQCWYRDPGGPCGASYNLTDTLSVLFTP